MKFEEIESTWALQQPVAPPPANMPALQKSLRSQLGRRKRMLVYVGVSAFIGLLLMQLFFVIEMRSPHAASPWISLGRLLLHQGISLALLFEVVRSWLRHRRLAKGRASSVRDVVKLSLAGVDEEMIDYRIMKWILLVMLGHSLFSVYLNQVVLREAWSGLGVRVAIIFALYGLLGTLGWMHYRRVLLPRQKELSATLQQLDAKPET